MDVENNIPQPLSENPDYEGQCAAYAMKVSGLEERGAENPIAKCMLQHDERKQGCMQKSDGDLHQEEQCMLAYNQRVQQCLYEGWFEEYKEVSKECPEKNHKGCVRIDDDTSVGSRLN
jgi:hypothetical protein